MRETRYSVRVFQQTIPTASRSSIEGFATCRDPRFTFALSTEKTYDACDVAVMFGCVKRDIENTANDLRRDVVRRHRGPILMAETAFLARRFQIGSLSTRVRSLLRRHRHGFKPAVQRYWRLGLGGAFADDADFANDDVSDDRWKAISEAEGLSILPYRTSGSKIIIALDNAAAAEDIPSWATSLAQRLRQRTDKLLVFRPHQNTKRPTYVALERAVREIGAAELVPFSPDLTSAFGDCWACICGRSGISVDALLAGVPTICLSPQNIAYSISSNSLDDILAPKLPEREKWLWRLAYAQWTHEEIGCGIVWGRFRGKILAALS